MMLAMQNETVCFLSDLRYACISCKHCNTKVMLDLLELAELAKKYDESIVANMCPGCGSDYDSALRIGLSALRRALSVLNPIADTITFRGELQGAISSKQ